MLPGMDIPDVGGDVIGIGECVWENPLRCKGEVADFSSGTRRGSNI